MMKMLLCYEDIRELTGVSTQTVKAYFKAPKFRVKATAERRKQGRAVAVYWCDIDDLVNLNEISLNSKRGCSVGKFSESKINFAKVVFYSDNTGDCYIKNPNGKIVCHEGEMWILFDFRDKASKYKRSSLKFRKINDNTVTKYIEVSESDMLERFGGWHIDREEKFQNVAYAADKVEKENQLLSKYRYSNSITVAKLCDEDRIRMSLLQMWSEFTKSASVESKFNLDGVEITMRKTK